jgi:putative addiction module component (TIGR02574 family)
MSLPVEKLEAEALDLPQRERARLAQRLIASLETEPTEDLAQIEAALEEEIQIRLADYRSGKSQAVPISEVIAEARRLPRRG